MPIRRGHDSKGCFYQWGHQTKYYYTCGDPTGRKEAKKKAIRQMVAISYSIKAAHKAPTKSPRSSKYRK